MNRLISRLLVMVVSATFAINDHISVVVNNDLILASDVIEEAKNIAIITNNVDNVDHPHFIKMVKKMMINNRLLDFVAKESDLLLTSEEEDRVLESFMEHQGKKIEDFDQLATESGVSAVWFREHILKSALQQKIALVVVGRNLVIEEDELIKIKHKFIAENTKYKLKVWNLDLDHSAANFSDIKTIKEAWAKGEEPTVGEVSDLGWKSRVELPAVFIDALEGIEPGNLVGPVRSDYGCHLIWYERIDSPELPSDEVFSDHILKGKFVEEFEKWTQDLAEMNVVIHKDE